ALVALYRPGPMAANMHNDYADRKNGRKPVSYLHPDLEPLLADTQGLMIFQESVMRVAQKIAGYSLAEADNLRKACGKKIRAMIALERDKFVAGCEANGYGRELGTALFDIIEPFADYAFPKSHAYGYGYIAYQTAYLKANYPVEYLAALLTSVKDDQDRSAVYLSECRQMGITVLVPDINLSASVFAARPEDATIPFGLSAVRNVGEGLVGLVISERDRNGPFVDFHDFCERVDPQVLNKRAVESLVKAGAFDSLGHERRGLLVALEPIIDRALARRRERQQGVMSLFGDGGDTEEPSAFDERVSIPDLAFDKMQRLAYEKEMLGLYVSDHPLMGMEHLLRRKADCTIRELREAPETGEVRAVAGVVTHLARKYTRKGDLMAIFVLEDLQAAIEVMVFPRTMADFGPLLVEDAVVAVKGRLDTREEPAKIICMEVVAIELATGGDPPLRLRLPPRALDERAVDALKQLLSAHPGEAPVYVRVDDRQVRLPAEFSVDQSNGLRGELLARFGAAVIDG
ncbi:MAG: DNA polymerase III subunit alpha, partial [Acidimicrobiia bacterium]|nr:DNA polymerase III subunit alpha [Acidimicrobiia bacterium]